MIRKLFSLGARICSFRRKIVFEAALEEDKPVVASVPLQFRFGDAADLLALTAPEYSYDNHARAFGLERLEAGDRLVIGESGSTVVFYAWISFGQMDLGMRAFRTIPVDCVYTYKLFTVSRFRGQRICPAYYSWLKSEMRSLGFGRVVAWVEAGNRASIQAHLRAGFHQAGVIWHWRLLFRSYYRVSLHREPTRVPVRHAAESA